MQNYTEIFNATKFEIEATPRYVAGSLKSFSDIGSGFLYSYFKLRIPLLDHIYFDTHLSISLASLLFDAKVYTIEVDLDTLIIHYSLATDCSY